MALRTPLTAQPHLYIGDSTGRPLDYGRVYFGEPNKDPEFYPIDIYLDPEMTIAAAQPVRTKGGFMDVGGNLAELHAAEFIYSLKVLDQYGRQVFYKPEMYRNNVSDFLVDEITRATAAETLIAGNLTAETQRAVAAEEVIADAVVAEKDRAIAAEDALDGKYATLDNTVAGIVNGRTTTPFATKALMTASALADGKYAMVTDDTDANNGLYEKSAGVWSKSKYDTFKTAKDYVDEKTRVNFLDTSNSTSTAFKSLNDAIVDVKLSGDYEVKPLTVAAMSYVAGNLNLILAQPLSTNEVMTASGNTKFVSRFNGDIAFTGVQTLTLVPYGNTALGISGEITIDFSKLTQSDMLLTADYVAKERLINTRNAYDLNINYRSLIDAKYSSALVTGIDKKNDNLNAAIEEMVFFKPLPSNYLILNSLTYTADGKLELYIRESADKTTSGSVWAVGFGKIETDGRALVIFDQGYAIVKTSAYYPDNTDAAKITYAPTYLTRGINKGAIKIGKGSGIFNTATLTQFNDTSTYYVADRQLKENVQLYILGDIKDTDYYILTYLAWSRNGAKYQINYQIKKLATKEQDPSLGLVVYGGNYVFDTLADIKGKIVIPLKAGVNGQPFSAELGINFDVLGYSAENNSLYTPYIFNKTGTTFASGGFDPKKLKVSSDNYYNRKRGGVVSYPSLHYALQAKEAGLFSIGGNTFKSKKPIPTNKNDFLCVNNPPKPLKHKPTQKEYDFYYMGVKLRLEIIDKQGNCYFINNNALLKTINPFKATLVETTSSNSASFVMYDVQANTYHSVDKFSVLFTKESANVTSLSYANLTYDNELFIAGFDTTQVIMLTENKQTSLRTFNFNGSNGKKFAFGQGALVVKDWSFSHHKNVMFISDYDTGVNGTRGTTGGQKCYVSYDNGYTFSVALDFTGANWGNVINASNITNHGGASAHIHAVTYDPKQDIVWVVTGDGAVNADNSSFFWSRDLGQTWTHQRTTRVDNYGLRTQMIKAMPFDGCVAFGSDNDDINGVTVITYNGTEMVHETVENFIPEKTGLFAFARGQWDSLNSNIKYMAFGRDPQTPDAVAKSFVIASSNGYHWEKIWESYSNDVHSQISVFDDMDGRVYVSLSGVPAVQGRVVALDASYV